jgi:serine/threonine-protein kinase
MAAFAAECNLLFGLLALQTGLIDQAQLVAAFHAWTRDKARPLADHLVVLGHLDVAHRPLLEGLAAAHLAQHSGDAEKSLAAIPADRSTRARLARIADHDIEASLAHVGAHSTQRDEDADRTTSFSVGSATSDGQRFQILRPHARGGLGAVFVARDTELHREVALKQILEHHADDQGSRARFVLEAEITGGLEHPGIVPVYGLGTYPDGRPYYAMRFIRGESFKEAIAAFHAEVALKDDPGRRSLALRKLLRRFLDLCNAIDYAHSRGVLHRDIKPANVIVGKYGETLVVDWGLAKAVGRSDPTTASEERTLVPSLSSGSAETLPGSALGTPAYMSPEQAAGDLEHLGQRSDVYSLGATLYCLLTGKPPIENDDVGTALRAVQRGDILPPRQLDPAINPALEAVCLKAMALRAEDRYHSARALAEDLDRWMADEPVTARKEPLLESARRWMRRRRTAMTAAGTALAAGVLGLAAVLAVQARANVHLTANNGQLTAANARVTRANADLLAANERERERFNLAMEAVKLFHGEVSEDLLLKEKPFEGLRTKLLHGAAGFYGKLERLLETQTDSASRAELGTAYQELGELTDKIGSKPEALAAHRKALAVRRELAHAPEADAATQVDVAQSLLAVGWLQHRTGDMSGALASYEEVLRLADGLMANGSAGDQPKAVQGLAYQRIGRFFLDTGKPAEAQAAFERSIAIREKLADAHPDVAQFQSDLGAVYGHIGAILDQTGKVPEALDAQARALAIRQKLADANPSVARFLSDLAESYHFMGLQLQRAGKPAEALAALKRALVIRQELADANPNVTEYQSGLAADHESIGWALGRSGKPAEALAALEGAIRILQKLTYVNPSVNLWQGHLAMSLGVAGGIHLKAGRTAEGVDSIRRAVAIWMRMPSRTLYDLYNLSCSHAKLASLAAEPSSGMTPAEGRAEADRAMERLREAVAAGYRKLVILRTDTDLDPLRSRDDFKFLMMDVAFPAEPFAPER